MRRHGGRGIGTLSRPAERLWRFFSETIWEEDLAGPWRRFFYPKLRVLTLVYRNYWSHNLSRHAAALTYSTLLAIVPVLAVAFALFKAFLFEAAKWGFANAAGALLSSYQRVYGAVALPFVVFFWIWLSWMILLVGLEFVVATQSAATHRREELAARVSQQAREAVALRLMTHIAEKFYRGEPPPTATQLAGALDVPIQRTTSCARCGRATAPRSRPSATASRGRYCASWGRRTRPERPERPARPERT